METIVFVLFVVSMFFSPVSSKDTRECLVSLDGKCVEFGYQASATQIPGQTRNCP